ncbi:hypothetical protein [Flavobacterium pectinovorum]|uniref:hypothetical protein n=1 Tax=Flavobacterium pectinovorum TaxID=29533 RepID=UPI001FAC3874|nr:hypothetical protein [Flavobacterium pectinovorum]MCI9844137.1 hypothetical protein [Flavobacterium pectinovorum]
MKNFKKHSLLVLLLLIFIPYTGICQQHRTAVQMPTQQNTIIVNKIIEAARYKTYFVDYCLNKINETANKEKWNEQKTMEITETINFRNFRDAVYNLFAFHDEIELETLLKTYQKDKIYQTTNIMTSNQALNTNLDIYARDIVKGKYIIAK